MSVQEDIQPRMGMPMDEFIRQFAEQPFELFDGGRINLVPNIAGHSFTIRALFRTLDRFVVEHQLGEVFQETTFVLADTPDWVKGSRIPDLMYFSADRITQYQAQMPDWLEKPYILVPDLAVEVVSPTDKYTDLNRKVTHYLRDGVRLIWIVDPQQRNVTVYTSNGMITLLNDNASLDGADVLPGFELAVSRLFPDL